TYGRVPYAPVNANDYTAHIGPMARTVADAALMLQIMAGPHPLDHTTCETWPPDYLARLHEGIAGRRIGFSPNLGHARVDAEVAELVGRAAEQFGRAAEVTIEQVTPAWGKAGPELIRSFWPAHLTRLLKYLPQWESRMDSGLVACMRAGAAI